MSTPGSRAEDLKFILRGLLISSPHAITVDQLERDFKLQEGQNVPFRDLGYPSFMKYLESIPDTVVIHPSLNGGSPIIAPVLSDKSAHIDSMVQKQKVHPPKRSSRVKHPAPCRSSVKATPQMSSAYYSTNHNSSNMQQGTFIPAGLQQRIYAMVHEKPKGVPVQTIEQELHSSKMLQNYGIHEGFDINHMLRRLDHLLKISNGMVYPLHNKAPLYRPIIQNPVTDNKTSNIHDSQTYMFIPAGHEGEMDVSANVVNEFSAEKNKDDDDDDDDDADIAEALDMQAKVTEIVEDSFVSTTRSVTFDTEEDVKVSPGSGSPSDVTDTYICDFASELVSKKMRINFQTLLDKHPNGIWCSELPDLYKEEFGVVLEYTNLGFVSVMHMASTLPDVFHCITIGGTEWKLFDARKKLPPEYATYNIKNNNHVSTEMVPTVPSKIRLNIKKLVANYSSGLPTELIPHLYKEEFLATLNVHEMGFGSLETFLLVLQQLSVLHMRYVKDKILVYPIAQETEPEKANPFPHIVEPQDHFLSLYPPEVVGPKGTLTHEKIPPEATPGGFIEVLVAEIYSPLNFWIQLRGENTHMALDTLMNDMQVFYQQEAGNYNMPEAAVRIGQYCVAPYKEEWHRACITAVHNFVDVQVLFVDYGTTYRVKKSELRFMHMDYAQFPIQAIKASLANLVPVGGERKWPREASVYFLELVEDKNLIAIVSSVEHEAQKLEVALVDTTGDEDIHINDVLVSMGLAEYKTKRQASPLPLQPKRIDGDPTLSTITVSRPPPGFTAVSELHQQPLISPTGSAALGQSKYVPEMPGRLHQQTLLPNVPMANTILSKSTYVPETQGQSHLLISLPTLPMSNTIQSNFIPQPTSVPVPPVMYDVPLLANTSSLAAQSSVLQHLALYENFLQQQQLMRYYTLLASQNIGAASLMNPFMVPVVYIPTPASERITDVEQSELGISEVPLCTLPSQKNASGQISPSCSGHLAAAAEDFASAHATFDTHTETREPPSVMSSGVSHLSVIVNSSPEKYAADLCDEQLTAEAIASPKEVKAVSQVTNEQQQNKGELVHKAFSNTSLTKFSSCCYQSDDMLVAESHGLESESHFGFESQYMNEGREPGTDLSTSSDEIYRSDDEDDNEGGEGVCEQQKQPTLRKSSYVKQIEIAGRVIHLIKVMSTIFLCTEEVVKQFTDFSGRHVVLKIMDARGVKIPFCEIERTDSHAIIDDLESYNVVGVPKSPNGYIIGKVHLTPLTSITHLIPLFKMEDQEEFCSVMESVTW